MKSIIPLEVNSDGDQLFDALSQCFARVGLLGRKKRSQLDIQIGPQTIKIMVAINNYYNEKLTVEELVNVVNSAFRIDRL